MFSSSAADLWLSAGGKAVIIGSLSAALPGDKGSLASLDSVRGGRQDPGDCGTSLCWSEGSFCEEVCEQRELHVHRMYSCFACPKCQYSLCRCAHVEMSLPLLLHRR